MLGYGGFLGPGGMPGDVANQTEKQHFMAQAGDTGENDVLPAARKPPPSPYAVMAGSYFPAVLETAVNSGSPGAFIARISNDVYSTRNGSCVIIPAGSKLIGRYDSQVAMGQERLPGVITRIIYPDTTSADLGAMEAADQSGAAGFDADVNTHFWQRLGNGLIIGISGIGQTIAQTLPFGSAFVGGPASAINSVANLGLNIPPTLTAAPGTRINIITGKDLALRPWACNGRAPDPQLPIMQVGD
jgi:type IV secretion system protein VirB10